jgi:tetratricopeptide (TPR) repeat protein
VEEEDHESHYDLGVAFKEMGLVDEAIAEFQKALRGTANRARTFEALGQCFVEKGQTQVAMTILQRALSEPGAGDDQLVGVLYLLGDGAEALGQPADAIRYFQRVFAVDITFRDVGDRLNRLEQARA